MSVLYQIGEKEVSCLCQIVGEGLRGVGGYALSNQFTGGGIVLPTRNERVRGGENVQWRNVLDSFLMSLTTYLTSPANKCP